MTIDEALAWAESSDQVREPSQLADANRILAAEVRRLRALVREAYYEGWNTRAFTELSQLSAWNNSTVRARLVSGARAATETAEPLTPDQQDAQDETDAYRARGGRAR